MPALAQSRAQATKLPDLTSYNCGYTAAPPPNYSLTSMHIGQVIKGRYAEWNEFYLSNADDPNALKLACISQMVPKARQLSAEEAKGFLTDSLAIGAPSGAVEKALAAPGDEMPEDVKVEPLKRPIDPRSDVARAQSATIEAPPVPVTRSSDPNSSDTTPLAKSNAVIVAEPETSVAKPQTAGVEDRTRVANTTAYPWNTIGYLLVTYPNGESYRCSGTLVSPYTVLTAGHCIHNNPRGGFIVQARFYPGQYQSSGSSSVVRPYASHADWQNLKTTQRWIQVSGSESYPVTDYQSDFAAIQFKTPFTHTSTFMPVVYSSTTSPAISAGYPAYVAGSPTFTAWTHTGNERSLSLRNSHVREFAVDSSGGNSGGPFWINEPATGRPVLVGSLSYGDDLNDRAGGPWYDGWNQALLKDWMAYGVNAIEVAQNLSSGLRVASVFSSAQRQSQSFVRLYNPSSVPGTVNITLADYATGNMLSTWTSPVIQPGASAQYSIWDLELSGSVRITDPPAFYSLSIRPTFTGYFQHVLWQMTDGAVTNITTCDTKTTSDPNLLMNVHSSTIFNEYPSTVVLENTGTAPTTVLLGIYDARNGQRLGGVATGQIPANGQSMSSMLSIQNAIGYSAPADMFHFIVKAESPFTGYLQHLVRNMKTGVVTDMSQVCAMNP